MAFLDWLFQAKPTRDAAEDERIIALQVAISAMDRLDRVCRADGFHTALTPAQRSRNANLIKTQIQPWLDDYIDVLKETGD